MSDKHHSSHGNNTFDDLHCQMCNNLKLTNRKKEVHSYLEILESDIASL